MAGRSPAERDPWDFLRATRNEAIAAWAEESKVQFSATVKPEAQRDSARLGDTLRRSRQDPLVAVRLAAKEL